MFRFNVLSRAVKGSHKLSGRNINNIVDAVQPLNDFAPLEDEIRVVDAAHVGLVHIKGKHNAPLGVTAVSKAVDVSDMKKVKLPDDEEYDVSLEDVNGTEYYLLRNENGVYGFRTTMLDKGVKVPQFELDTEFTIDKDVLSIKGSDAVVFDYTGDDVIITPLYREEPEGGRVVKKLPKKGGTGRSIYPLDYFHLIAKMMKGKVRIRTKDSYPMIASTEDDDIEIDYLIAPRIENE